VALFGGADGLDLYRKLFNQLMAMKWRPALLIGEFGFGQEEEMNKVLKQAFGSDFTIIPDLAGIPRVFVINFARVAR
jgi:release factor glutamine methyltransferase